MKKAFVYVHGKGGSADEVKHYEPLFPQYDVIGFDYRAETPWDAKAEFAEFFGGILARYDEVVLAANSIGAFFSLGALSEMPISRAYLISPVTDMEGLILGMMAAAGVPESELEKRGEIPTDFGETLSWKYLSYVREHPVVWNIPTKILYGGNDRLVPFEAAAAFAERTGAELTVMEDGEHWFHTDEQMAFLDRWMTEDMN